MDRLAAYITELELEGYSFHIHTIGNRGVREAPDAIEIAREDNGDVGAKHQLTHIEFVNPSDLARFQELLRPTLKSLHGVNGKEMLIWWLRWPMP